MCAGPARTVISEKVGRAVQGDPWCGPCPGLGGLRDAGRGPQRKRLPLCVRRAGGHHVPGAVRGGALAACEPPSGAGSGHPTSEARKEMYLLSSCRASSLFDSDGVSRSCWWLPGPPEMGVRPTPGLNQKGTAPLGQPPDRDNASQTHRARVRNASLRRGQQGDRHRPDTPQT